MMVKNRSLVITFGTVLLLLAFVYAPGLKGGFFFDDDPNIVKNAAVHLETLSVESLKASVAGAQAGPLGRPISVLSFALTHYFFGLNPFAFKAINLAIHAVNGLLVAYFVFLLIPSFQKERALTSVSNSWLAIWVATVWLLHPINAIPVLLAVQRMTLLSGMFCLLGLIAHLKATGESSVTHVRWGWLISGWLVFWPLAVLSKETGLLFPLFVMVITFFQPKPASSTVLRQSSVVAALAVLLLGIGWVMGSHLGWHWLNGAYMMRPFSLIERLMTEARVLWFYAAQITLPNYEQFALFHDDFALSKGLTEPVTTGIAVGGLGLVAVVSTYFRSKLPILCLATTWFLAGHSMESTFLPLELVHEYRNYLPSIGLIFGVGWLGATALRKVKLDSARLTTAFVATMAIGLCAVITWTRAAQLGDPLVGPQIEAERHPTSARANHAAAVALIRAQYGDKGDSLGAHSVLYYLSQASKVDTTFKLSPLTLIIWACASDRPIEASWVEDLASRLATTPFSPQDLDLPLQILRPLIAMPKCLQRGDALKILTASLTNPKVANSMNAQFLEAAADYELLVALSPLSARSYLQKAALLAPSDKALIQKLNGFSSMDERANGGSQKGGS